MSSRDNLTSAHKTKKKKHCHATQAIQRLTALHGEVDEAEPECINTLPIYRSVWRI